MSLARFPRLTGAMTVLAAIIALLVLADVAFAAVLVSRHGSLQPAPSATQASPQANPGEKTKAGHPCNHGFYVSQAAHAKKGGAYVSGIAKSGLGKDGNCTAPLPAQAPSPKPKASGS
jgi:hypothetical protein